MRNFEWVEMLGRVEDLRPLSREYSLAIAPVAFGAGTSIKVLESFAYGRPCVMNRYASRGLEDLPEELAKSLIAESISEMADLVKGAIEADEMLGEQCFEWVDACRSISQFNRLVHVGLR